MSSNTQDFQLLQQWFWPTNSVLSPIMDTTIASNDPNNSNAISTITTTVSSTTSTFHRRHRHWWKVCWIYNNGNLVYHGLNKQSNTKQYHQQWHQQQEHQSLPSLASLVNDRCVKDDQLFSMAKQNMSLNSEDMNLSTDMQKLSTNTTNNSSQICSSHTSLFLQQKLTQPFTALLKQKAEHKNSITQFFIDYKGAEWRAEQLRFQIPTHDIQMLKQTSTEIKFVRNQQRKAQIKPQLFFNKSSNICCKCKKQLEIGSYGVKISIQLNGNTNCGFGINTDDEDNSGKLTNSDYINQSLNCSTVLYHVDCFTCFECCQVLVDFKAFLYHNNSESSVDPSKLNRLYCCRHFVELYKPRCQYCDHLIFEEECTEAEGKVWHIGHFCCTECKRSLGGQQYIMADPNHHNNDRKCVIRDNSDNISDHDKQISDKKIKSQQLPYCLTCFDILFGELCEECGELIGCDVGAISHEGRSWHASNACFKCNMCSKSLLGKPFLPALDGRIYCSIVCSQEAIKRNRYREKKKQRDDSINSVSSKHEMSYKQSNHLTSDTVKGSALTPIAQISSNCEFTKMITQQNNLLPNNEQTKVNLNNNDNLKLNESDSATNSEKSAESGGISVINKSLNQINDQTLHQYISQYQHSKAPNYILEYLRQQLQQNGCAHRIIGATLEYGSSVSEDERTNQVHAQQTTNESIHHSDQITSSSSSSRNATPLEINSTISNNALKYPHLPPYSSSSNETTPLLMRPYSSNAKPLDYRLNSSTQNGTLLTNSINSSKLLLEPLSVNPEHEIPHDQSSNSSCAEHSSKVNTCVQNENKMTPSDTPSTQSTALQSTSSQTTPETNPRSVSKSVSFDPNVKETSSKKVNRKNSYQKSRTNRNKERNYCGDNHSCSTCSTCSSSSSSDDNFDYQSVLDRNKNQWYGGTKIQYVTNERKKKINGKNMPQTLENNDSCTIS